MADPRVQKLADLLVNYCVTVQPGDKVAIRSGGIAYPLLVETYRQVIRAGGFPLVNFQEDALTEILLKEGNDAQLQHIPAPFKTIVETYDCSISLLGSRNTRTLNGVDPARQQLMQSAGREMMQTYMARSASGDFRWALAMYPTEAQAQDADMSLSEYEDFVYSACFVDKDDPVAE